MSLLQAHLRTEFSFVATVTGKITTFILILAVAYLFFPLVHGTLGGGLIPIFLA